MTVPNLKAALKEQGLSVSGKKAELIERLKGVGSIEEENSEEEVSEETETIDIDYDSMTVPNLKAALKEQGLSVSGKKAELIERLKGDSE
jgi:hypothetical protein